MVYTSDNGRVVVTIHTGLETWDVYYKDTHSKSTWLNYYVLDAIQDALSNCPDVQVTYDVDYSPYDDDNDNVCAIHIKYPHYKFTLFDKGKAWAWKR